MKKYNLTQDDHQWKLRMQGNDRATKVYETKAEAVQDLRNVVSGGSVMIHRADGQFQEERTYPRSIDPRNSPG